MIPVTYFETSQTVKSKLKIAIIYLLFFLTPYHAQVFESGFSSSAVVELKRTGEDINGDGLKDYCGSMVTGRKVIDLSQGKYSALYDFEENNTFFPFETCLGDFDGDGVDDIAMLSKHPTATGETIEIYLNVFKGDDGELLYQKNLLTNPFQSKLIAGIIATDFTGDGIDELIIAPFKHTGADKILPYFYIYDKTGELILEDFPFQPGAEFILSNVSIFSCDYDGDQFDDIILVSGYNKTTLSDDPFYRLDICKGGSTSFSEKTPSVLSQVELPFLKYIPGNFYGSGRDNVVFIYSEFKNTVLPENYTLLFADLYSGTLLTQSLDMIFPDLISGVPDILKKAKLSNSGTEDLIISFRSGADFNFDSLPDQYLIKALKINNFQPLFTISGVGEPNSYFTTNIEIGDYNSDGLDDLFHVYKASEDLNGDMIGDGSKMSMIKNDGTLLYTTSSDLLGIPGIQSGDGIFDIVPGYFNEGSLPDLAILFHYGEDLNNDNIKDGSLLCLYDPAYRNVFYTANSDGTSSGIPPTEKLQILNNEISDKELLRMIDLSIPQLAGCKQKFLKRDYEAALDLFRYYYLKKREPPNNYVSTEYYFLENRDEFVERINKFSTTITLEVPGFQFFSNIYDDPSAGALRLSRIAATFAQRCYKNKNIDKTSFSIALKAMISYMRWLDYPENYTPANNHALLFEIREYILASAHLNNFKQFGKSDKFSFQKTMEAKIEGQLEHIFPDGVHDEHSITYSFLIANALNTFADFFLKNQFYEISPATISNLIKSAEKQYEYFIYAVKPIELFTADSISRMRPDIPVIGDSESKIVARWFGKVSRTGNSSLLSEPIITGQIDNWTDDKLINNLKFAAYSNIKSEGYAPDIISKFYPYGGYFISRSNWVKFYNPTIYDNYARYLHFKAGEIVPKPGKYDGYTTNSRHGHADLLSVDIAAYNKNLMVDPGGYVNLTMEGLINSFIPNYYRFLFNTDPPEQKFDMVRSYFKSTGGHNTVNVNYGQALYKNNWNWFDLNSVFSLPTDYYIGKNIDYIKSGFAKIDTRGEYTHHRTVLYNKPSDGDVVFGDYWIIVDQLDFTLFSGSPTVEQIWHISPEQTSQMLNNEGLFTGDNFIMASINLGDKFKTFPSIIPGYTMTNGSLVNSRIVKYKALLTERKFIFITAILPYSEDSPYSDFDFESFELYDISGFEYSKYNNSGVKITFLNHEGKLIEDYVVINNSGAQYFWKPDFSNTTLTGENVIENHRFIDGVHFSTDTVSSDNISTSSKNNLPENYQLFQNYPNPFNSSTTIKFRTMVPERYILKIYDVLGNEIVELLNKNISSGEHKIVWDGKNSSGNNVASGIYFYRLFFGNQGVSKKMVLVK